MGLKGLLSKVVDFARGVSAAEPARASDETLPDEPIRTKTMAELLVEQGHLERAVAIYRALDGEEERLHELERRLALDELARQALGASDGVGLVRQDDACAVAWRVDRAGLARARAVLGTDGQLTLRVVRIGHRQEGALRSHHDRDASVRSGVALVDALASDRVVASVGLLDGDRFVSIAHATS